MRGFEGSKQGMEMMETTRVIYWYVWWDKEMLGCRDMGKSMGREIFVGVLIWRGEIF